MDIICVTNNEAFYSKYKNLHNVEYHNISLKEVMLVVRDKIHSGHKLLSHPLSGSVKPNETPFKTIFLKMPEKSSKLDYDSLLIIENSIITCDKFAEQEIKHEKYKSDFEAVDMALSESALQSIMSF